MDNRPDFERSTPPTRGPSRAVLAASVPFEELLDRIRGRQSVARYPNLQLVLDNLGTGILPETCVAARQLAARHDGDRAPADWRVDILEIDRRFRAGESLGDVFPDVDDTPPYGRPDPEA